MSWLPRSRWSRKARISNEGPNPKGSGAEAWNLGMMVSISGSPCSLHLPDPSPGQTISSVFQRFTVQFADIVRDGFYVCEQFLDVAWVSLGVFLKSGIEIDHIGVVVLLVVQVHGLFVYDRLQGVVVVGKVGKFVSHCSGLSR